MSQLDDLQQYANIEIPRRRVLLTVAITSYDDNPNSTSAPAILKTAPVGTWYLRETPLQMYEKLTTGTNTWTEAGAGGGLELQGNVTLAVETTGNDSDPERPERITSGDWSTYPFATIQAALDALPYLGKSPLKATVNVGAGSFTGAQLTSAASVNVIGTLVAATPATGPTSGTATGGDTRSLLFTGAGWTAGDLAGVLVECTAGPGAGQMVRVYDNTSDTLLIARKLSPAFGVGSVFELKQEATIINAPIPGSPLGIYNLACTATDVVWKYFRIDGLTGYSIGFSNNRNTFTQILWCTVKNCTIGLGAASNDSTWFGDCWVDASGGEGVSSQNNRFTGIYGCGFKGNNYGIDLFEGIAWGYLQSGNVILNAAVTGLFVENVLQQYSRDLIIDNCVEGMDLSYTLLDHGQTEIKNCTTTMTMNNVSGLFSTLTGTGNTGWGMNARGIANAIKLGGTISITGGSGEVTVDGTADVTWANLSSSGDFAVDAASGARLFRP